MLSDDRPTFLQALEQDGPAQSLSPPVDLEQDSRHAVEVALLLAELDAHPAIPNDDKTLLGQFLPVARGHAPLREVRREVGLFGVHESCEIAFSQVPHFFQQTDGKAPDTCQHHLKSVWNLPN